MENEKCEKKPIFKGNLYERGAGLGAQIPEELRELMKWEKKTPIGWVYDEGQYGEFLALFKLEDKKDVESNGQDE